MFRKSPLKATRLHQHKRRIFMLKLCAAAAICVAFAGTAVWLAHLERLNITSVEITGNAEVETARIQSIVERHLSGLRYALFPYSNIYLYPQKEMLQNIVSSFPQVSSVRLVSRRIKDHPASGLQGYTLAVSVIERKPAALWCRGEPKDKNEKGCYLMDATGFIFGEAPRFSGNAYVAYYGLVTLDNPVGTSYLAPDQFKSMSTFQALLEQEGIKMIAGVAKENSVREAYLLQGGKIIFKDSQDVQTLISSVKRIKEETKVLSPQATSTLDYLDLRFGSKVYYTFVGDNTVQTGQ